MKARPILFSGPMIRALLAGTKTQTRRIVKTRPENHTRVGPVSHQAHIASPEALAHCPYGVPGDLLWVRESIQVLAYDAARPNSADILYLADEDGDWRTVDWAGPHHVRQEDGYTVGRRTPSIHMPRAASRLTLEITDVRVERLQDISEADAKAEGVTFDKGTGMFQVPGTHDYCMTAAAAYQRLWALINGEESQAANPWCWCVSFAVHHQNVDAFLREREAA